MKQSLVLKCLVALNVVLLAVLLVRLGDNPSYAQNQGATSGSYAAVSLSVEGQEWDALFVLDVATRKLHAYAPNNVSTKQLRYLGSRNLETDLRR